MIQFPSYLSNRWEKAKLSYRQNVDKLFVYCAKTELWTKQGKPLYERYIYPLKDTDKRILKIVTVTTILFIWLGPKTFGSPFRPLLCGLGAAAIGSTVLLLKYRLDSRFNVKAAKYVLDISNAISKNDLVSAQNILGKLQQFEFKHLETDITNLQREFETFKKEFPKQQSKRPKNLQEINAHIEIIIPKVKKIVTEIENDITQNPSPDVLKKKNIQLNFAKNLLKSIEEIQKQAAKLGDPSAENLTELSKLVTKLEQIKFPKKPQELIELPEKINELILNTSAKRQFIPFLANLIKKMNPEM